VINSEEIITTVDHPFYVKNQGFIKAGELIVGDELLDVNGNVLLVENFDVELTDKPVKVYNFQVEDFHTYFVGTSQIMVHNSDCGIQENGYVDVRRAFDPDKLYVEVELVNKEHQSRAIIKGAHTNVILVERDHQRVGCELPGQTMETDITPEQISRTLNIRTIYEFVETMDRRQDDLHMIQEAIEVNGHIAQLGAAGDYGLNIGHGIRNNQEAGLMGHDVVMDAVAMTASGVDARMAGANAPVITNSGSGNQGITATVPILSAAKSLGIDEERTFRAVTLSNLMAIHIHADFGPLSGLCGATIAAAAAACGLVYLQGGTLEQIGFAVNNMFGNVSGMLCDGAKADCALKISTCVFAAFQCAAMALRSESVKATDGIVETDPEETIRNFVRLGNEGSSKCDDLILEMLLQK